MIISINDEVRIRGTEHCWQLEKSVKRKGQTEWEAFKYFVSLSDAVGAACGREIRLHSATGLTDAIQAVDQIVARYSKYLDDALAEVEPRRAA